LEVAKMQMHKNIFRRVIGKIGIKFVIILAINLVAIIGIFTYLQAQSTWCIKINKIVISAKQLNSYYESYIDFQALLTPESLLNKAEVERLKNDSDKKKEYAKMFIDESVLILKAQEMNLIDKSKIKNKVTGFSRIMFRQLILREFAEQYVSKLVDISSSEMNEAYEKLKKDDRYKDVLGKLGRADALKLIKGNLKAQKMLSKMYELAEEYKGNYSIYKNPDCF